MTPPQQHSSASAPPPGCPAHQGTDAVPLLGPRFQNNDRARLYREIYEQHGPIAPVVLDVVNESS